MANHLFIRNLNKCGQEISVLERTLEESDFESDQPTKEFAEIATPLAIVKTLKRGSKLFDDVETENSATHIFCVLYTATLSQVESKNYFIDLANQRYKILSVIDIDEKNDILIFQAVKRGLSTKEAPDA